MSIIVKSGIKELAVVEEKAMNVSSDFAVKLADKVKQMIKEACIRAKENHRTTVMAKDL